MLFYLSYSEFGSLNQSDIVEIVDGDWRKNDRKQFKFIGVENQIDYSLDYAVNVSLSNGLIFRDTIFAISPTTQ